MRILVVDDSASMRALTGHYVQAWGDTPEFADNGNAALTILTSDNAPKMALVDWVMPGMDGVELCKKIKKDSDIPFIYIILITGKSEHEDILTALDAGADEFLSKPVQADELRSRVAVGKRILEYQYQLADRNKALIDLNELKNRFLGMAAHDLRNPIGAIQGLSEHMLELEADDESDKASRLEMLNRIYSASGDLLTLLNDLLDVSVIESGKFELTCERQDLVTLVDERIQILTMIALKKDISISAKMAEVPEISFDHKRFSQVIDNLLSNAIKFSQPGTIVQVAIRERDNKIRLSVRDQGPGIASDEIGKLFGVFQKLSAQPTAGEKSTGLGLSIVKKIVDAHNGEIEVQSHVGEGCIFTVSLPIDAQ